MKNWLFNFTDFIFYLFTDNVYDQVHGIPGLSKFKLFNKSYSLSYTVHLQPWRTAVKEFSYCSYSV